MKPFIYHLCVLVALYFAPIGIHKVGTHREISLKIPLCTLSKSSRVLGSVLCCLLGFPYDLGLVNEMIIEMKVDFASEKQFVCYVGSLSCSKTQ